MIKEISMIYLDNSATTRQHDQVTETMLKYMKEDFLVHALRMNMRKNLEESWLIFVKDLKNMMGRISKK